jgi:hypothetical protein
MARRRRREKDIIHSQHDFQYSKRWFLSRNHASFCKYIYPKWAGKPIFYLEIGVFEGLSMVWMMQHVLTHPDSKAVGVDPWLMTCKPDTYDMDKIRKKAFHNTSPWKDRCKLVRANSVELLLSAYKPNIFHGVQRNSLDLCMIDGDHTAPGAWNDARLVKPLLKRGGWMLFDDVENDLKKRFHVKDGIKLFLKNHGKGMKLVWKHRYMECYEKTK